MNGASVSLNAQSLGSSYWNTLATSTSGMGGDRGGSDGKFYLAFTASQNARLQIYAKTADLGYATVYSYVGVSPVLPAPNCATGAIVGGDLQVSGTVQPPLLQGESIYLLAERMFRGATRGDSVVRVATAGGSAYTGKIQLPSSGQWRIRAYVAGGSRLLSTPGDGRMVKATEPNDSLPGGPLAAPHYFKDRVDMTGDVDDYYSFTATPGAGVAFTAARSSGDADLDLTLYTQGSAAAIASDESTATNGRVATNLPLSGGVSPRTYYLRVNAKSGAGDYWLSFFDPDDNIPGVVGPTEAEIAYEQVDASGDTNDVYAVELEGGKSYQFTLSRQLAAPALDLMSLGSRRHAASSEDASQRYALWMFSPSHTSIFALSGKVPGVSMKLGDLASPLTLKATAPTTGTYYLDVRAIAGSADYELSYAEVDELSTNTEVAIDGPDDAAYSGSKELVEGVLTCDIEGQPLEGMPVRIEYLEGTEWKPLASAETTCGDDGAFELMVGPIGRTREYRAVFDGFGSMDPCVSEAIEIRAKLRLGRPVITARKMVAGKVTLTGKITVKEALPLSLEFRSAAKRKLGPVIAIKTTTKADGTFSVVTNKLARGPYQVRIVVLKSAAYEQSPSKYIAMRIK